MTLRRPSKEDLVDIGQRYHINPTEAELDVFFELAAAIIEGYDELDQYPDPVREVIPAVRIPGRFPRRLST